MQPLLPCLLTSFNAVFVVVVVAADPPAAARGCSMMVT